MTIQQALLGGSGFGLNWLQKVNSSASSTGYTSDASNNAYVLSVSSSNVGSVAKIDPVGTVSWQKTLSGLDVFSGNIAYDSSGYIYIVGADTSTSYPILVKLDTSGTIVWSQKYNFFFSATDVGVDSTGNVYVTGYDFDTTYNGYLIKYNSSGALQWQRKIASTNYVYANALTIDSSDNIYVVGGTYVANRRAFTVKYNSSGTFLLSAELPYTSYAYGVFAATTDSSNNLYMWGAINNGTSDGVLVKFNSSLSLQWQKQIASAVSGLGLTYGTDGYLYAVTNNGIVKLDTSGNGVFFNTINFISAMAGIRANTTGTMSLGGYGVSSAATFLLPSDGSKLGTYLLGATNVTYASATLTVTTPSMSVGVPAFTYSTPTNTSSSVTVTAATSSFTANLTYI